MPFLVSNHLAEEEMAGSLELLSVFAVKWLSLSLPRGTMGWFAVYDCGISLSYYIAYGLRTQSIHGL